MNPSKYVPKLLIPLAALLLAGCTSPDPPPATPEPPAPAAILPTPPPASATPAPTETPRPISPACLPDAGPAVLETGSYDAYPAAILDYLNAFGSPVALSDLLNRNAAAAQPVSAAVADFTGDGRDDVVVSLIDSQDETDLKGRLVIYACSLAGYEIALNIRAEQRYTRGFHLWSWVDLNADGSVELLVSQGLCGAHTCFDDLMILGWDGAAFGNVLEGSTIELPYPLVAIRDADGDGVYRIEVSSGGFGSVGAGPQRPVTWIWAYNPGAGVWRFAEERPDPSPYRIHVLHDADDAAAQADYDFAVQLYRRVIEDESLDDWVVEDGYETLAAYARYRIAVIAVALQDDLAAEAALAELEARYPAGDPRRDFVEMAILFRNAFASGGLGAACTAAAGFAESHAAVILDLLGGQVYGYANRDYTGESMCPAPVLEGTP